MDESRETKAVKSKVKRMFVEIFLLFLALRPLYVQYKLSFIIKVVTWLCDSDGEILSLGTRVPFFKIIFINYRGGVSKPPAYWVGVTESLSSFSTLWLPTLWVPIKTCFHMFNIYNQIYNIYEFLCQNAYLCACFHLSKFMDFYI